MKHVKETHESVTKKLLTSTKGHESACDKIQTRQQSRIHMSQNENDQMKKETHSANISSTRNVRSCDKKSLKAKNAPSPVSADLTCKECGGTFFDKGTLKRHCLLHQSDVHSSVLCVKNHIQENMYSKNMCTNISRRTRRI